MASFYYNKYIMKKQILLEDAKRILKEQGYELVKKFKPNKPIENISMFDGLLQAEKEHKKVIEYLKDK